MSTACLWGQEMRGTGVYWAIQEVKGLPGRGDLCLVTRWGLHGRVYLSGLGYKDFSISAHRTEVQGYNTLFCLPQIHLICSKKDLLKKRTWWARKTSTLLESVNALVISSRLLPLLYPEWHQCFQSGLGPLSNLRLCFTGTGTWDQKERSLEGLLQASPSQPLRKGCSSLIEQTGAKLPGKASPINATWHLSLRSGPACVCTSVFVKCCSRVKRLHVHVIKQSKAKPKPNKIPKWHVIFFLTKYVILLWWGWAGRGGRRGDKGGYRSQYTCCTLCISKDCPYVHSTMNIHKESLFKTEATWYFLLKAKADLWIIFPYY